MKSNNLLVYDKQYNQIVKFDGRKKDTYHHSFNRKPHFSFEGDKIIWFGGKTCLNIVDLTDLSIYLIDHLIPMADDYVPEPLHVVADFKREKILTVFLFESEYTLVYYEKGREPDMHILSEIFPQWEKIDCVDLDKNKCFGFIGGTVMKADRISGRVNKLPSIAAFTFNKKLEMVAGFDLPSNKSKNVGSLIMSPTHDDVLFVGSDGPLYVVGFDMKKRKFHIIKAIEFGNPGKFFFSKIFYRESSGYERFWK